MKKTFSTDCAARTVHQSPRFTRIHSEDRKIRTRPTLELVVDWIGAANAHAARGVSATVARASDDRPFSLGNASINRLATSIGRRVLPAPPAPVKVTLEVSQERYQAFAWTGKFTRAQVENLVGGRPAILFASPIS